MASKPPLILGCDTAAAHCVAALVRDGATLIRRDEEMARGQAERLLPMLEEMLDEVGLRWDALDALAVCTGPGNFTGLRLSVAAARGLALALGIPAVGVTVFEALAAQWPGSVLVALEDRRGDVLAQRFRDGAPTSSPLAGDPSRLGPFEPTTLCIGYDAPSLARRLGLVPGPEETRADPLLVARIAAGRLRRRTPPAPLYLRPADAMPSSDLVPALLNDS